MAYLKLEWTDMMNQHQNRGGAEGEQTTAVVQRDKKKKVAGKVE